MNEIKYFIPLIIAILFTGGCKKNLETEGLSKVTDYPVMTLNGDAFLTILQGAAFTDPGVVSVIKGENAPVTVTGSVDANTPGVYIITYTTINEDGFARSLRRWVGVIDASAAANDFSGTYQRTTGVQVHWAKIQGYPGLYTVDNVGGVAIASYVYDVYVFNTTGNTIVVPLQPNALGGDLFVSNAVYNAGTYTWVVNGAGYATNPRTFVKL